MRRRGLHTAKLVLYATPTSYKTLHYAWGYGVTRVTYPGYLVLTVLFRGTSLWGTWCILPILGSRVILSSMLTKHCNFV